MEKSRRSLSSIFPRYVVTLSVPDNETPHHVSLSASRLLPVSSHPDYSHSDFPGSIPGNVCARVTAEGGGVGEGCPSHTRKSDRREARRSRQDGTREKSPPPPPDALLHLIRNIARVLRGDIIIKLPATRQNGNWIVAVRRSCVARCAT